MHDTTLAASTGSMPGRSPANPLHGMDQKRVAVVLCNLGGPDCPEAVRPFLYNLFSDPAIIRAPAWIRYGLAHLISRTRAPKAQEIYAQIGGGSPLRRETDIQAQILKQRLQQQHPEILWEVCVAMRYWAPYTHDALDQVVAFGADSVVFMPLYPQYSTTTTGSSWDAWKEALARRHLSIPTRTVCCYPTYDAFIVAYATYLLPYVLHHAQHTRGPLHILFSAHGLPESIIKVGDPYAWQVEQSVQGIVAALRQIPDCPAFEPIVCYQSKVGPMAWIKPSTEERIDIAAEEGAAVIVVPIAFVSEHSETLVELDREYAAYAEASGVVAYTRVPTLGIADTYMQGMVDATLQALSWPCGSIGPVCRNNGDTCGTRQSGPMRLCPAGYRACPASVS